MKRRKIMFLSVDKRIELTDGRQLVPPMRSDFMKPDYDSMFTKLSETGNKLRKLSALNGLR